jgi:hypothetical protein
LCPVIFLHDEQMTCDPLELSFAFQLRHG